MAKRTLKEIAEEAGVRPDMLGVDEGSGALNVGALEKLVASNGSTETGLKLPNKPNLPNQGGDSSTPEPSLGISTSMPAVSEKDIRRNTEREFAPGRSTMEKRLNARIEDANAKSVDQNRALEGQLGTGRRFSSSASAFLTYIGSEQKKNIANLELQKEEALASYDFKMAQMIDTRIKDAYSQLSQQMDDAIKMYELAEKKRAEEEKKNAPTAKAARENAITGLFRQGIKDPAQLQQFLNFDEEGNQVGDISLEEVDKVLGVLTKEDKDKNDLLKKMGESGAPPEIIDAVAGAGTLADAVKAAGDYLAPVTGIVGEYSFYRRQALASGQAPVSFQEYQDIDANRKRQVININSGGLSPAQTQNFLRVTDKYQADPLIMAAQKGQTAVDIAGQVLADPNNAANQLKSLYVLVKNLDPDSAVREGETALAAQTQSYLQRFRTELDRVSRGVVISPDAAKLMAEATIELAGSWQKTAAQRTKQYQSQAKNADPVVGTAFDKYLSDFETTDTPDTIISQNEGVAEQKLIEYGSKNPESQQQIESLMAEGYSNADIMQIMGISI